VEIKSNIEVRRSCSISDSHGLTRHVNSSTHEGGHTLDLVISRESSAIIVGAPSLVSVVTKVNTSAIIWLRSSLLIWIRSIERKKERSDTENIVA